MGLQADHLLKSEAFGNAINSLSEQLANALLSTALEDQSKRERFYMMHSCLNELVAILKSRAQAKDNIEAMFNEQGDEGNE
jgi:hypothetical protein